MKEKIKYFVKSVTLKQWTWTFVIIGSSMTTYLGFDSKIYKLESCESVVSKYVTAHFSETTSGVDYEGEFYSETDYWDEPASEVLTVSRHNSLPEYPPMPVHDKSMSNDHHFDRFSFHTNAKLNVLARSGRDTTYFTEGINKAQSCLDKLKGFIVVKEWWGISFSSDFGK